MLARAGGDVREVSFVHIAAAAWHAAQVPKLGRRHLRYLALGLVISALGWTGAAFLADSIGRHEEPVVVQCGDPLPWAISYRLENCAVETARVVYSYRPGSFGDDGPPQAAFLPLASLATGESTPIVLRTTEPEVLAWAAQDEVNESRIAYSRSTTFRAGRTVMETDERQLPSDAGRLMQRSRSELVVLETGDTTPEWWLFVYVLCATGLAGLGTIPLALGDARRAEDRARRRAEFDDAMAEGRRELEANRAEPALDAFRRAFELARTLDVGNGVRTAEALIGAGKARAALGLADEARETLVRALAYLDGLPKRTDEIRALASEAVMASDALADP